MYKKLINTIEKENINYINHKLYSTKGMIAHYDDITAIIVDNKQITSQVDENTVLLQELGHYISGAYYRSASPFELIEKMEHKADKTAWEKYIPYEHVMKLMSIGFTTVTDLAEYFDIDAPYMARCMNYYYNQYGFNYQ